MKKLALMLCTLFLALSLSGCGSDSEQAKAAEEAQRTSELEAAGQARVATIGALEVQMKNKGVRFTDTYNSIKLTYDGAYTLENDREVQSLMQEYSDKVTALLNDYPADRWSLSNRSELTTKVALVKQVMPDMKSMIARKERAQELEEKQRQLAQEKQAKHQRFLQKLGEFQNKIAPFEQNLNDEGITFKREKTTTSSGTEMEFAMVEYGLSDMLLQAYLTKDKTPIYERLAEVKIAMEEFYNGTKEIEQDFFDWFSTESSNKTIYAENSDINEMTFEQTKVTTAKFWLDDYEALLKRVEDLDLDNI